MAMLRLDQAYGRAIEALTPLRPPPPIFALRRLVEPIIALEAVLIAVGALCEDLCAKLDQNGVGTRLLRLSLFGVDGGVRVLDIGMTNPERSTKPMMRLLRERLNVAADTMNAEFGFEIVRLDAVEIAPIIPRETDLAPVCARDVRAEARVIDALRARLGVGRVGRLALRPVHAPERASAHTGAQHSSTNPPPPADGVMRRPLRLFPRAQPIETMASVPDGPPARFRWRRVLREVARAEGPERIEPDWLRAPHARPRDYYRVEDAQGRRYWLYREGHYADAEPPRWFLHGLFA
jgi:protein ImuB